MNRLPSEQSAAAKNDRGGSRTLRKAPRRTAFWLSSANQRSIGLSQLELVGMKCNTNHGRLASHLLVDGERIEGSLLEVSALKPVTHVVAVLGSPA